VGEFVTMTVDAGAVLFGAWPGQRGIEWIASHPLETLQSVLGLGFVIFVHELGHFLVAKACGVKCEKFYLGFDVGGLKLCSFKWGETEYGIGALPLGGYVKMLGQDDNRGAATASAIVMPKSSTLTMPCRMAIPIHAPPGGPIVITGVSP
jgi:membrane-associated protease RseP (regulator of RpoE activity)